MRGDNLEGKISSIRDWAEKPSEDKGVEWIENWQHSAEDKLISSDISVFLNETKEVNPDGGSYGTEASSVINDAISIATATRRLRRAHRRRESQSKSIDTRERKRRPETKGDSEQFEKQQIDSIWNDSLYFEVQYGMEIAELLEMYSLHRYRMKGSTE